MSQDKVSNKPSEVYFFLSRIIEALGKNNEGKRQGMWHRREI